MKQVCLIMTVMFTHMFCMGQANVVSGALSVQGIARDVNNNAIPNSASLPISAELYYLNNNNPVSIELRSGTVTTDAFGIFAYVMEISTASFIKISNREAWIRISSGSVTFANEKLRMVPYAIHAQNGVPTGTIMAFAGNPSAIPQGWMLCDGRAIPNDVFHNSLRVMLGNNGVEATNVPDLRGMFLRGVGTNGDAAFNRHVGPTLRSFQSDSVMAHNHPQQGDFTTNTAGQHTHGFKAQNFTGNDIAGTGIYIVAPFNQVATSTNDVISREGSHNHSVRISGNTGNNGSAQETRPVNYGIHYIIKI